MSTDLAQSPATLLQLLTIFGLAHQRGRTDMEVHAFVKGLFGKALDQLTRREASALIMYYDDAKDDA
jgi:hypothetical protein